MGRLLLLLDSQPKLRSRAMRAFAAHPNLFARLVAVHIGNTFAGHLASTGALLGWRSSLPRSLILGTRRSA